MRKYLWIYAVGVTAFLLFGIRRHTQEIDRLCENQRALTSEISRYRTRLGQEAASVQVLRLRCAEFEELHAADAEHIRRLGIRLRRVEAAASSVISTAIETHVPLRDTILLRDTLRMFRWRDAWVTVEGAIKGDSAICRVKSIDTLRQIVHRVPRRFLCFRWGTKALRQEIVSSNPHTHILYTDYIHIER